MSAVGSWENRLSGADLSDALSDMWRSVLLFVPTALAFLAILIIGYLLARLVRTVVGRTLRRIGFDRAVERGAIGRALGGRAEPSDLCAKIAFYAVLLFALQLAFGIWGPNAVSDLLTALIGWLPRAFVAIVIIVVAAAVGGAVRDLIGSALGGLAYGRVLARAAYWLIVALGVIAALDQVQIATAVTQPVLIAVLATVAGVLIVGVGGGLIRPMQLRWEVWLERASTESATIREHARSYADERARVAAELKAAEEEAARIAAEQKAAEEEAARLAAAQAAEQKAAEEEAARVAAAEKKEAEAEAARVQAALARQRKAAEEEAARAAAVLAAEQERRAEEARAAAAEQAEEARAAAVERAEEVARQRAREAESTERTQVIPVQRPWPGSDDQPHIVPGFDDRPHVVPGFDDRPHVVPGFDDRPHVVPGFDDPEPAEQADPVDPAETTTRLPTGSYSRDRSDATDPSDTTTRLPAGLSSPDQSDAIDLALEDEADRAASGPASAPDRNEPAANRPGSPPRDDEPAAAGPGSRVRDDEPTVAGLGSGIRDDEPTVAGLGSPVQDDEPTVAGLGRTTDDAEPTASGRPAGADQNEEAGAVSATADRDPDNTVVISPSERRQALAPPAGPDDGERTQVIRSRPDGEPRP